MVNIKKIGNDKIKIDEIEISIKDYNDRDGWYKDEELALKNEYKEIAKEILIGESKLKPGKDGSSSDDYYSTDEYLNELKKVKKVNDNLYREIEKVYDEKIAPAEGISSTSILENDDETKIKSIVEFNNKRLKKLLELYKEVLPKIKQIFTQKEKTGNDWGNDYNDPNKDKSREELGQRASEIEAYRKKVKGEIEAELNKEPKITKEELESGNQGWESEIWNSIIALGEKEIDDIKTRVLADISAKRGIKQGKRKREDEENENTNDNSNKKPKVDHEEKNGWDALKNSTLEGVEDNTLAAGLKVATRMEGEEEFKNEEGIKKAEEELSKKNPQLYRDTIIDALQERINDNKGVSMNDLSEETKKLMRNEITDIEKFKELKDKAIKEIGELGAKSRWNSFFSQANALLTKAKQNVTKQIKEDIKKIQEQMKSFKAGTNSYLSSIYQQNKSKAEALEKEFNSISASQTDGGPKETPWGIIIPVSLVVLSLIGIVAVVIVRRKRKQDKVKAIVE